MVVTCQGLNYLQEALSSVTQVLDQALGQLGLAFGQPMSRDAFLKQLDAMLTSTDLYNIVTPDKVYPNVNLVAYNHAKKSDEGGTLIIAELMFREVRETVSANYNNEIVSSDASAASPVNLGTVNGTSSAPSQTAAFNNAFPPPP